MLRWEMYVPLSMLPPPLLLLLLVVVANLLDTAKQCLETRDIDDGRSTWKQPQ